MPSTYTSYYNLNEADKAAKQQTSARSSVSSTDSTNSVNKETGSRRSSIKKILDNLKPVDRGQDMTPSGISTPVIQNGPLFSRRKNEEWNKLSRYQKNAAVAEMMR